MEREKFILSPEQIKELFSTTKQRSDLILQRFLIGSFVAGLLLAIPYDTWFVGIAVGSLSLLAFFLSKQLLPNSNLYQYVGSAVLAIFMAQYIYQMHGLFEMHFFAFVACTVMITYANWKLQIPLFLIIVIHHATFAYLQFIGIEGIYFTQLPYMDLQTFLLHAGLAGLIISICGLWGYYFEKQIIEDGVRALKAESVLAINMEIANKIKEGDFDSQHVHGNQDPLSLALMEMRDHLQENAKREALEKYSSKGVSIVSRLLAEINTMGEEFGRERFLEKLLHVVANHLNARQGTFFMLNSESETPVLQLVAGYAYEKRKFIKNTIPFGEGLIGQVALEQKHIVVRDLPHDYFLISSSLGSSQPKEVLAWPLIADQKLVGVMEFAGFDEFEEKHFNFLEEASLRIASSIATAEAQIKTTRLLKESEALKIDLQESNQQLGEQAEKLLESEKELRAQQSNLLEANNELAAQTQELEVQKKALIAQNEEIEDARASLIQKAEELESSNAYKSEFLANMSHELRTPLNSILILANILADNKAGRLGKKDVEHARVIHKAGNDLLTLINDILDLSKIEAGKLDIFWEPVSFEEVGQDMELLFRHVAVEKGIDLQIEIAEQLPVQFESDRIRLEQILKNLLSNACKFTPPDGAVSLHMFKPGSHQSYHNPALAEEGNIIAFEVKDTGIGIPKKKQAHIFSAFSQADGSTSRKYGGTGLGLSICVQLSKLLGGEIQLESVENKGSTFTLFLPLKNASTTVVRSEPDQEAFILSAKGSRNHAGSSKILIVEDQEIQNTAIGQLLEQHNYAYSQTYNGTETLTLLKNERNLNCIVLDYNLPDMTGLDILKEIRKTQIWKDLPVIIHTAEDLDLEIQQEIKQYTRTIITKASQSSQRLIDEINLQLGTHPSDPKHISIRNSAETDTPNQPVESFTTEEKQSPQPVPSLEELKNLSVFLVDDDMRNIFAISAILENQEMLVTTALNGREAIDKLEQGLRPDFILMDIMMPEMDGIEVMQRIRKQEEFDHIPIIAITAKAMEGDRETCLEAGANEYLSKPLNPEMLLEKMSELSQKK